MKIALASDHAAFALKDDLAAWLVTLGHEIMDLGTNGAQSVDYPDFGYRLARHIAEGHSERGIALCGTGIGISIAVNRHPAIRCALVSEPLSARLARDHNDANILALGARIVGSEMARACVMEFISTPFGNGRHSHRVAKLTDVPQDLTE